MKVIDLLVKISKGEEVPEKIKWEEMIFTYDETDDNEVLRYYDNESKEYLTDVCHLDTEIEIIEEPKKIEHIDSELNSDDDELKGLIKTINYSYIEIAKKINEIIDYINKENK